jgi:hypothetical protein
MAFFCEFIMQWLQNLKNFGTIKIDNKDVIKWLIKLSLNILFDWKFDVFYYNILFNVKNLQVHLKAILCWKWKNSIIHLLLPTCTCLTT